MSCAGPSRSGSIVTKLRPRASRPRTVCQCRALRVAGGAARGAQGAAGGAAQRRELALGGGVCVEALENLEEADQLVGADVRAVPALLEIQHRVGDM